MTRTSHRPGHPEAAAKAAVCIHCGTPFEPTARESEFCCSGCRFVHHMLHKRGLEDFYRYGEKRAPVGSGVFQERAWDWLRDLQRGAEERASGRTADLSLRIQGISCAGCVWLIEAVFLEQPGAVSCRVDSSAGVVHFRWDAGNMDLASCAADLHGFGYVLGAQGGDAGARRPMGSLVRRLGICGALAMNAMLFALPRYLGIDPGDRLAALFDTIGLVIATASIAVGGTYFFRRALGALRRGDLHIDLPISLGLIFACAGSLVAWRTGEASLAYFDFVSIFTFLMLLGRWLQERSVENNRRRLLGIRLAPDKIKILRNGLETDADAQSLSTGDRFSLPRNGLVPVRARLVATNGVFALNWINGEPDPRRFPAGAIVPAGARSLCQESLTMSALEPWADSRLAKLLAFDAVRPGRNTGLQRLIRVYLACVLVLAAGGFAGWVLLGGGLLAAFQVLISVLVVSCPCAVGVALPLLDDVAAARLQPSGVYLREHSLWSRLRRVRQILFDKTGTITLESPTLANPETLDALSPASRAALLTLVESSLHPVAGCLRESLLASGIEPAPAGSSHVKEITGMGLEWETPAGTWRLGRAGWAAPTGSGTVFAMDGVPLAEFHTREEIRPAARAQIANFVRRGHGVFLLSGDEPGRVRAMAQALGLPASCGFGGLTPEDKASLVRDRWAADSLILGDGANDSLAFDEALCRGTPAIDTGLLEQKADFYLLGRSLAGLGDLFATAARRHRAATAVFSFAIAYNAIAVTAALAGLMNPLVAAVIMPLSSLASIGLVFLFLHSPRRTNNSGTTTTQHTP